ncbi:MAG TPA: hypothetical protein VL461_08795 [Dictyobacter sp.]|nr:hypothetical protein [Dictyobacter sp.]
MTTAKPYPVYGENEPEPDPDRRTKTRTTQYDIPRYAETPA